MKYFNTLPLTAQKNITGQETLVTNLLVRSYFLPSLLKNVSLFYDYDIREGDTPENIAYRYYNDSYRYWLVLYSNNIIDPYSQWPLTSSQLDQHLYIKYRSEAANTLNISFANTSLVQTIAYCTSTTHHYEKTIITYDSNTMQKTNMTVVIDQQSYQQLEPSKVQSSFYDGTVVTKETIKSAVSIYNYEISENEKKRKINLLKDSYALDAEKKFMSLMGIKWY